MVTGRVFFPKMVYCGIKILEKTNLYKKYTVENSSKIFCSMDWFNLTMPLGCNIIDSGIWVVAPGNATEIEHFARALETVEYMMGPIVLRGTSIEKLLLPNLTTIYSMFYDLPLRSNGWGYQILQFTGNQNLTEISFPKLENIFHYSYEAFIRTSDNPVLKCSLDTCNKMLSLFRFELDSCSCGLIPTLNKGYSKLFLALTITEAVCCAVLVITVYANIFINAIRVRRTFTNFQFSLVIYFLLSAIEAIYNVLNNIKFHDGMDYPWFIGIQFLMISSKEKFFYQFSNVVYTNRICLLLSFCIYRAISFASLESGKVAMGISFFIFVVANISVFNGLYLAGSQYLYVSYLVTWATFFITTISSIFLFFHLRKNFANYSKLIEHQKQLSLAFCFQALFSFIFCGFPQNLFNLLDDSEISVKRTRKVFEYYYGSVIIRWHYLIYAIFLRMYMHDMLKKVNIRSDAVTTTKKSYNAVAPANPNRAAH
ncbi:hypothetical protein CAEBREN_14786 [Caenorhabditis brenneri]|uniref:Uncharacterized protein n=1 Tax=Caenorhabditis brenneri TaxID=135651 RepID=G0MWG7_CAEBE|nr:hypothetical protein CAEBREN_14786 [Caenorhabditis brenneri]